jgi:hypothetical protein
MNEARCNRFALVAMVLLAAALAHGNAQAQDSPLARIQAIQGGTFTLGRTTVQYSAGHERRARQLAELVVNASRLFEDSLGLTFEVHVGVLAPSDWISFPLSPDEPYGMPWAWPRERLVVIPATLDQGLLIRDPADTAYNANLLDFIALHEFGHLCNREYLYPAGDRDWSSVGWFEELMASYFAYAFLSHHDADQARFVSDFSNETVSATVPRLTSLDRMHHVFDELEIQDAVANYAWYQSKLNLKAVAVHEEYGLDFVARFKRTLPWDDVKSWTTERLLTHLERTAPGFQAWAADFENTDTNGAGGE